MKSNTVLFLIIVLSACFTHIATDVYIPSVSAISYELNASINLVQFSMAAYMLGVAVSQLVYGPISEGIGRRMPMIAGLGIILVGCLLAAYSTNITMLIGARLIQGLGAGACAALWRTVFRDVYSGAELAKASSYITVVVVFVVPASPVLGGYLQTYFGWQANFIFLAFYALVCLALLMTCVRETSQHHHVDRLKFSFILPTYKRIITDRIFISTTSIVFLIYGGLFACLTSTPALLVHILGVSPVEFGWMMLLGSGFSYGLGSLTNARLVERLGIPTMLRFGFSVMLVSGAILLIGGLFFKMTVVLVFAPIVLFNFGSTFIWPNTFATAFSPFGDVAGYAGALYGFMQICGGAVLGSLIAKIPETNQLPLALVILASVMAAWVVYERFVVTRPELTT